MNMTLNKHEIHWEIKRYDMNKRAAKIPHKRIEEQNSLLADHKITKVYCSHCSKM